MIGKLIKLKLRTLRLSLIVGLLSAGCSGPPSDSDLQAAIALHASTCTWQLTPAAAVKAPSQLGSIHEVYPGTQIKIDEIQILARAFEQDSASVKFSLTATKEGDPIDAWYGWSKKSAEEYLSSQFTYAGEWKLRRYDTGWQVSESPSVLTAAFRDVPPTTEQDQSVLQNITVQTIRDVGVALMSWLTDEVGAAAAGSGLIDIRSWVSVRTSSLEEILVPKYLVQLPKEDAWGHELEYRVDLQDPEAKNVALIRSPGSNGSFETDVYEIGSFAPTDFERDIVWADGYFVAWPEKTR